MKELLEQKALNIVSRLQKTASERKRLYPPDIDAVLVFSGPGTYYDRLKDGQEEWMRWMDRDRIRAGVALVREITAASKNNQITKELSFSSQQIKTKNISRKDIASYGPFFVYNGTPVENKIIREALDSPFNKLPNGKVLIIDTVICDNRAIAIRHTGDQVQSFYQEMVNPKSHLHYARNIALVSHIPHFARIPFYISKYEKEYQPALPDVERNYFAFGLKDRKGVEDGFIESEIERLICYAQKGDVATNPIPVKI